MKKMFKNEATVKEELNKFYQENGMLADNFQRNFVAHKTIDYLFAKGLLNTEGKSEKDIRNK